MYPGIGIALLSLVITPGSLCNENIQNYKMTPAEVQQVFHTDAASAPRYEVVPVHYSERLNKRSLSSESHLHTKAFGENINLWLHPGDSILAGYETPVYYATHSPYKPGGVFYEHQKDIMHKVGRILEDPQTLTSMVIGFEESGNVLINGYIGSKKLAVRSLPKAITDKYRRRRSTNETDELVPFCAVIKTDDDFDNSVNKTIQLRNISSNLDIAIPDILYPEILLVVENSVYKTQEIYGLLQYLLALINGIDLKYRSLESPRVRFHISGIVVSKDPEATPYLSNNMVSPNAFNATLVIHDVGSFYWKVKDSIPLDSYDIIVTLTRLKFGLTFHEQSIQGTATVGTACRRDSVYGSTGGVVIVRDDGAFHNIQVLAHELGHVFGAWHDMETENCKNVDGFIMSSLPKQTKNSSDFSPCSMKDIQKNLDHNEFRCLYNKPKESGKALPRLMPGKLKNLDEQCKALDHVGHCRSVTTSVCANIYCKESSGKCISSRIPALDGTACEGVDKFCLHQQCISL